MTAAGRFARYGGWPWLVALLATYTYFVGAPAWNQNSRFALTRSIVERGRIDIDPYHATTGDKSFVDGHFYSDKAPGASWLATPAYAGFVAWRKTTGGELPQVTVRPLDPRDAAAGRVIEPARRRPGDRLRYNNAYRLALHLCTLLSAGLLGLVGAVSAFYVARQVLGARVDRARWVAIAIAIATPALPYTTSLYGHATCGALLIAAYAMTVPAAPRRAHAAWMGALAAAAVTVEYPAAVVAALLWIHAAIRHGPRYAATSAATALPFALALAAYHTAAFGDPLSTGYDFVWTPEFAEGMRVAYGLGPPDPAVMLQLSFGSYRGLFYLAPVLLLATWGLAVDLGSERAAARRNAALALAVFAYYLLLNSGYYMWDGGSAVGPRHMVPAIPFLGLGLVTAWRRVPRATTGLALLSAGQILLASSVGPEAPPSGNPLWEYAWGHTWSGSSPHGATNLGLLMGLPGLASLLPLVVAWWWALGPVDGRASGPDQKRPDSDSPVVDPS